MSLESSLSHTEALQLQQKTLRSAPDDFPGVALSTRSPKGRCWVDGVLSSLLYVITRLLDVAYAFCIMTAVFLVPKC